MLGAGIDLAFARDSSALVIVDRDEDTGVTRAVAIEEIRGGPASDPRVVVAGFAAALRAHRVDVVMADTHYRSLLVPELLQLGIECRPAPSSPVESYLHFGRELLARRVQLPPHPLRARLVQQLRGVRRKPLASGAMTIVHGRRGGGHGDIVAALVLAVWVARAQQGGESIFRAPARTAELLGADTRARPWAQDSGHSDDRWDGYDGPRW